MFQIHFLLQATTPAAALDDGTLRWDDNHHGTYEGFQRHNADLCIRGDGRRPDTFYMSCGKRPRRVPNRDIVTADLQSLFQHPPSFAVFSDIIHAKNGHSSWLQYKQIQNWAPDMIQEAYDCFVAVWSTYSAPEAWKLKWLAPIRKGASQKI